MLINNYIELIDNKLVIKNAQKDMIIPLMNIVRLQAESNYTRIYFANGERILLSKCMKNFDVVLNEHACFYRSHHSHIINLFHVKSYCKDKSCLILSNQDNVPVSRRKTKSLSEKIQSMMNSSIRKQQQTGNRVLQKNKYK